MNVLSNTTKAQILSLLVEGNSIRSIERATGAHRDTIMRLGVAMGERAAEILDQMVTGIKCNRVEADEIWAYVGKKQKRVTDGNVEQGDQYTFVAMDAETKLIISHLVGKRDAQNTDTFIRDLSDRVRNRFQLSTDGWGPYVEAVDKTFGAAIDYAVIIKNYEEETKREKRYSPAKIIQTTIKVIAGNPDQKFISTSYIERQNLTMRMQIRRFTRLTNAFSKKVENLRAAVALHFFHYNFMRVHSSLRVTPAMEAKITNRVWGWEELLGWGEIAKAA